MNTLTQSFNDKIENNFN